MSMQVNTLFNNIISKVDSYKSELLSNDNKDFENYLDKNFKAIDSNKNEQISKDELLDVTKKSEKSPEIQKLLDNKNLESLMSKIDTGAEKLGFAAQTLTQKLSQNLYSSGAMNTLAKAAVSYVL